MPGLPWAVGLGKGRWEGSRAAGRCWEAAGWEAGEEPAQAVSPAAWMPLGLPSNQDESVTSPVTRLGSKRELLKSKRLAGGHPG